MYDRKDTHRDDIIRRFGSPRRRRSRHGKPRQAQPTPKITDPIDSEPVPRASVKLILLLFIGGAIALSLMFIF